MQLSKDDFTRYGGVYGNKQDGAFHHVETAMQSSASSVVLPALEWSAASEVPALMTKTLGVSPVLIDPDTLSELKVNPDDNNLLYLNLPYCTGLHESCAHVLRNNDKIIGKVLDFMKAKNIPYSAIYTGLQPSWIIPETLVVAKQHPRRSLLESAEPSSIPAPLMFNTSGTPCIMLWAQNLSVSFDAKPTWTDLATQTPTFEGSTCNGSNSVLVLNYPNGTVLRFEMSQKFSPVSARNWFTLDTVSLAFNGAVLAFSGAQGIYAPAEYSFHCMSVNSFRYPLLVRGPTHANTSNWMLNFVDFQIQGFGLENRTDFSYASDCAGFFTAGIWMGLLSTLLMLWILAYGLTMILQVTTMDRFDDPKGPAIYVPQTD